MDDIDGLEGQMIQRSVGNKPRHSYVEGIRLSTLTENPMPMHLKLMSFHQAAKEGSLDVLENILKLIHESLESYKREVQNERSEELLYSKINAKDSKGMTALHYAAQNCNTKVCDLLYKYSFIPPLKSGITTDTNECAIWWDHTNKSQLDIYSTNPQLATPLHMVAQGKKSAQDKIVKQLSKKHTLLKKTKSRLAIVQEIVSTVNNDDNCLTRLLQLGNKKELKDIRDNNGMTPLHWAAQRNNVNAVTKLIQFEPDLTTPTHKFEKRKMKIPTFFTTENSTLLDAQDNNQMTALSVAAANGAAEVAELLIELEADWTIVDKTGKCALHHAASEGNLFICQLILERSQIKYGKSSVKIICGIKDKHFQTPLHLACQKSDVNTVKLLIDNGHNSLIQQKNNLGNTPFHSAAMVGASVEVLELFCNKQVDISVTNNIGRTALHIAAQYNHHEAVAYLILQGANLEAKDHFEKTPLLLAVQFGHANLVSCMLQNQCNIIAEDIEDMNCLHIAALFNQVSVLMILLEQEQAHTLINTKDQEGNTPLHFAAIYGHTRVAEILIESSICDLSAKDSNEQAAIHLAAIYGHTRIMKMLWRKDHSQLYYKDESGNTPLLSAAMAGKENSTKSLINMRANIEEGNNNSYTALTCCALNDYTSTARILLKAGANVGPLGEYPNMFSPLHVACINGSRNMVNLLLEYDASVTLSNSNGLNSLELAIKHGHEWCVKEIIDSPKWKAALRSTQKNKQNNSLTTPLREMIKTMPDMAQLVFSKCTTISPNKSWDDANYNIKYDFEFIDDIYSASTWQSSNSEIDFQEHIQNNTNCFNEDGTISTLATPYTDKRNMLRKNHPLNIMSQCKNTKLLSHPLIKTLLHYKWKKYGRTMYYSMLFSYVLFLLAVTLYIIPLPPPYLVKIEVNGSNMCYTLKTNNSFWNQENCYNSCCQHVLTVHGITLGIIIIILSLFGLAKEGFQIIQMKFSYFKQLDNYTDMLSYVLALISISIFSEKTWKTGIKEDWQWQLAALCVLITWINFALFVRKLPLLGIYVIMVTNILKTFGKFFITYAIFVCGFGLFYYMMLQNQSVYNTWYDSIIKTTVMMVGELDYESIFYSDTDLCENSTDPECVDGYDGHVEYPTMTKLVFVFFLFMMPIIIMNLLVGLAVDDIQSVQEQAARQKMAMQIKLALDVEFLMPESLRKKFTIGHHQVYPNMYKTRNRFFRFFYQDEIETIKQSGAKKLEVEDMLNEEKEYSHKKFHDIKHDIEILINNTKKLHESVKNIEAMYRGGTQF